MSAPAIVITGSGLFTPPHRISNEELVTAYNAWAEADNARHAEAIAAGQRAARELSSAEFIVKASGIHSRHVMDRDGVLNPARMCPNLPERDNDSLSLQAEMAVAAGRDALAAAGRDAAEIDMVIVACSNMQRAYPAMAIEVQQALGCGGFAYDMNVACSSATFGMQAAVSALSSGAAKAVLMVNPEITSGHLNFCDRDSHFIFGDACTAVVLERADTARSEQGFEVLGCKLATQFSNNIRNNFGFLNRAAPEGIGQPDKLFVQQGRKVFKEVCPMVAEHIEAHLASLQLRASDIRRYWLHQANLSMNQLIVRRLLGRDASLDEAPVILDRYANTSSAGSVIAWHLHQQNLPSGALGVLASFGAGYSVGSVVLRKR